MISMTSSWMAAFPLRFLCVHLEDGDHPGSEHDRALPQTADAADGCRAKVVVHSVSMTPISEMFAPEQAQANTCM